MRAHALHAHDYGVRAVFPQCPAFSGSRGSRPLTRSLRDRPLPQGERLYRGEFRGQLCFASRKDFGSRRRPVWWKSLTTCAVILWRWRSGRGSPIVPHGGRQQKFNCESWRRIAASPLRAVRIWPGAKRVRCAKPPGGGEKRYGSRHWPNFGRPRPRQPGTPTRGGKVSWKRRRHAFADKSMAPGGEDTGRMPVRLMGKMPMLRCPAKTPRLD